jgi:predicted SAM-dependent methyltransferase
MALRLNIGGIEVREGWKILNIQPGPGVDYVGNCATLGQFAEASVDEIYAAHVLEHLGYQQELAGALREMRRVLIPGGVLRLSVPDLDVLCRLFVDPALSTDQRFFVMRMMFGGQIDEHDFHRVGLNWDFLSGYLAKTGFHEIKRVAEFGLFPADCSAMQFGDRLISLNVVARKL